MARKNKPGAGRPTVFTPIVIGKLEEAASMGCTIQEMSRFAGIHIDSYFAQCKRSLSFSDRMDMLRESPILEARTTLKTAIKGGDGDLALKYLERKRKTEFSTLQQVEVSEQSPYRELSDEQLAQIAMGKATPADFVK